MRLLVGSTLGRAGWGRRRSADPTVAPRRTATGAVGARRGGWYAPWVSSEPLRIWADPLPVVDVRSRSERLSLSPVLRPVLDDRFDRAAAADRYGSLLRRFLLTGPDEAEVALLPRLYEATDSREVVDTVRRAEARGLRTLVFSGHDLEPVMASESVILLHPGPTRGGQPSAQVLAVPYIFADRARWPEARPDGERPTVAFCGQGTSRPGVAPARAVRRWAGRFTDRARSRVVSPPAGGHVRLRAEALDLLTQHPGITDRFVVRDQYRAGVSSDADRVRTQAEFDDNLRSATYALCVRGTGNFSARFYESLSFGRVPLFVDTDCVLPFEDEIDWRSRTVWLDHTEVNSIGDRLMSAHPEVLIDPERSPDSLRRLWEERLTEQGFYDHLPAVVRRLL